ncbi:glycosyltransferase [Nocardia sp. NPDC055053]
MSIQRPLPISPESFPPSAPGSLSYLFVCDEWLSTTGGIAVVNRALAVAAAENGNPVTCLVETATTADRCDAEAHGVTLVTAATTPSGPSLHLPVADIGVPAPDVVVGHDRITGHIAWLNASRYDGSALVHLVHTAPAQIEPYKDLGAAGAKADAREEFTRRIAEAATVVAAVGPRLTRYATHILSDGYRTAPVVRLDPGLDIEPGTLDRRRCVPTEIDVLVLGRTGDVPLKGLDIAAAAIGALPQRAGVTAPTLRVRGAPAGECEAVHRTLTDVSGLARGRIDVRPYAGTAAVGRDLRAAALCLMPSRADGFGLVTWEAIAAGTPVLVSAQSGAADLLREKLGTAAEPMIVEVTDDLDRDRRVWARAVDGVCADLPAAFAHAHTIRELLAARLRWSGTAAHLHTEVHARRVSAEAARR